jgi:hypothetical protein
MELFSILRSAESAVLHLPNAFYVLFIAACPAFGRVCPTAANAASGPVCPTATFAASGSICSKQTLLPGCVYSIQQVLPLDMSVLQQPGAASKRVCSSADCPASGCVCPSAACTASGRMF